MAKSKVGIVGLGIMGGAFAHNLLAAGWRVVGYDIDRRRAAAPWREPASRSRPMRQRSPPRCRPSSPACRSPPRSMRPSRPSPPRACTPRVVIEASTFTIDDKLKAERALRKAGHVMLDCPVSGTGVAGQGEGPRDLRSGDRKAIRKLRPLFAGFSRAVHDLGAFGNGSRMKYVANLLVAINNVASAEAMVLGIKAGLDAADRLRHGQDRRRQFARVRIARADDGEGPLRRRHHEDVGLAEGHGRDRRASRGGSVARRRCSTPRCRSTTRR